jgi:glycosyltransferase involved in cell wall biosynthesis
VSAAPSHALSATIAAAIERVTQDEPLRARLRDAGLARAARFTWAATAAAHLRAYASA